MSWGRKHTQCGRIVVVKGFQLKKRSKDVEFLNSKGDAVEDIKRGADWMFL